MALLKKFAVDFRIVLLALWSATTGCVAGNPPTRRLTYSTDHLDWKEIHDALPDYARPPSNLEIREEWWDYNGHQVHLDRVSAIGEPRQLKVILLHGGAGHGRALLPYAALAAEAGFEVVTPDLPGFGLTIPSQPREVRYETWVSLVTELIETEFRQDGRPVVLFALSIGGTTAYHAAARSGNVAGIVTTTFLDLREPDVIKAISSPLGVAMRSIGKLFGNTTDGMWLPMRWVAPLEKVSNDSSIASAMIADKRLGQISMPAGFLRSMELTMPKLEPEAFNKCPVLLLHPGADEWTPPELSFRFLRKLAAPYKYITLGNAGHLPIELPGFNQLNEQLRTFLFERERAAMRGGPL